EAGSPNMLGIHALDASLSLLEEIGIDNIESAVLSNSRLLCERIGAHPALELLTDPASERLAGIVTFRRPGVDSRLLYQKLQTAGVICAQRGGGIRFAPHFYNRPEQLDKALELAATL